MASTVIRGRRLLGNPADGVVAMRWLDRRILTYVAVAIVAALAAGAAFFAFHQYDDGKAHAENELRARVFLAATVFDTYFNGQLTTLAGIASSPEVVSGDAAAMQRYFARVQPPKGKVFTAGLGWIDLSGKVRASSNPPPSSGPVDVAERQYFKAVVATGKPFVSGGVVTKLRKQRAIVMAVPTRDGSGRLNGVLAGSLLLKQSRTSKQAIELGFEGLVVIDRNGRELTLKSFPQVENRQLLARMRRHSAEVLGDASGLSGDGGRVVAYASSAIPRWIMVIDRPPSVVFASARRTLVYELVAIGIAALIALLLVGWAARRSRRAASDLFARTELLSRFTRSLAEASNANEVADALAGVIADTVPDARVLVALMTDGDADLKVYARRGAGLDSVAGERPALLEPAREAFLSKQPILLEDRGEVAARYPDLRVPSSPIHVRSLFAVPVVIRRGRAIGAVSLLFNEPHPVSRSERALVAAHVEQAAHTLTRTLEHERDHDVAVTLQRSLLPARLPSVEGIDLAARYQAGSDGLEVGGDWYATVPRPDGILHVSVGDVAGRGIPAATLMAQLRHAYRAYAFEHDSPAEITRRLIRHMPDAEMVTIVCLAIDPYTRRFRHTHAGHPPSIVIDPAARRASWLAGAGSPPLGFVDATAIREHSGTLPEKAIVVAYTDGLVERRGASIDQGIEALSSIVSSSATEDVEELADDVLKMAVSGGNAEDDAAFIVIRCASVPSRMDIEFPADPFLMAPLRSRLEQWLSLRGIGAEVRNDTILAVHEACINAVEHAYELRGGTIHLVIEHEDDSLRVLVEDRGRWTAAKPESHRGRGIVIMRATMENVYVDHDEHGTRVALERRTSARPSDLLDGPISTVS